MKDSVADLTTGMTGQMLKTRVIDKIWANGIRTPVATTGGTPATHWLVYTGEFRLRGLKTS